MHVHFGLTAWPGLLARGRVRGVTLHGTDLAHPRSRAITLAALRRYDLVAAVSEPLARSVPGWAVRGDVAVLPVGVATDRFTPIPRGEARRALGLDPDGPLLLFPADPARPEKRYDRARQIAGEVPLLTLGNVRPEEVPLWVNAASAVLVPSEREGFGLAVLEALACDVPVLATPVGIAPRGTAGRRGGVLRAVRAGRVDRRAGPAPCGARPADRRPRAGGAVLHRPDGDPSRWRLAAPAGAVSSYADRSHAVRCGACERFPVWGAEFHSHGGGHATCEWNSGRGQAPILGLSQEDL